MKAKKTILISVLASILLVFSTLSVIAVMPKKAKAYVKDNAYASALVETSINTNFNVVRGSTYQLEQGFTSSPKTIEALVRLGTIENWKSSKGSIIGGFDNGLETFNLEVDSSNHPRLWWRNGEVNYYFKDITLPQNEWVHLVMVRDTTNNLLKCYVNGNLVGSVASQVGTDLQVSATNPSPAHYIGRDARIYNFFSGSINYVGLSSKIMSDADVSSAYNNCQRLCKDTDSDTILAETCVPRTYYMAKSELSSVPNTITTTINVKRKDTVGKNNNYVETPIVDAKDTGIVGYIISNESYTGWGSLSYNTFELNINTNGHIVVTWDPNIKGTTGGVADLTFDTPVSGYTGSLDVRTGTDMHIAVVRNKSTGTFSLYLNGVHASNTVANEAVKIDMIPTLQLAIGKSRASNSKQLAFPGKIKDVAFYSSAMSAVEIATENTTTNKTTITKTTNSSLIVNWVMDDKQSSLKFDKNANYALKDYSGNNFDATLCSIVDYFAPETENWFEAGDDEYTLIYIPDTQCTVHSYSVLNDIMFDWIVSNKDAMNLQFVMGLGDIVDGSPVTAGTDEANNPNYKILSEQWDAMAANYQKLTDAGIYWSSIVGNHDYDINNIRELKERKAGAFNEHFGLSSSAVRGTNNTDFIKNSIVARYHTDTVATEAEDMLNVIYEYTATTNAGTQVKYLVVALEFGPSKDVLEWANEICSKPEYANHRILFNTHSLIYIDGAFGDTSATCNPSSYWYGLNGSTINETYCEPDFMWEYFMSQHPNMFMAGSGHIETDTNYFRQDKGVFGNTVTSFLCDGQGVSYFCSDGDDVSSWGDPLILVAKVNEKTKKISYRYYNPVNGCFLGIENQFEMDFSGWEAKSYNVTWKNYDDSVLETDTDVLGGTLPEYNGEIPTKAGYTFMGWATTLNGTPVAQNKLPKITGDTTYYAIFASNDEICNITWVVDGNTTTTAVLNGAMPVFDGIPYKYGYVFTGWDKDIVSATENATYTALFSDISVWDGTYPNVSSGYTFMGSGTQNDPWLIQSAQDLAAITKLSYATDFGTSTQYYKLTIDLDLSGANWQPICFTGTYNGWPTGSVFYFFKANFDGNNKTIKVNLNQSSSFGMGLFGGLSGSVKNLTIDGTFNVGGHSGALIGKVNDGAYIENVANNATVIASAEQVGGIAGGTVSNANITFKNCVNNGSVTGPKTHVAGILGQAWANVTYINCENTGDISGANQVGGICGELWLNSSLQGCVNSGTIKAGTTSATRKAGTEPTYVGYLIGQDSVNTYYTVTWNVNGTTSSEYYAKGETPVYNGKEPTKESTAQFTYTFSGWSPTITAVTGDVTYTAQFTETIKTYTITWVVNGEEITTTFAYGETPSYDGTPTKPSDAQYTYTFDGWDKDLVEVTQNATYIAQFKATPIPSTSTSSSESGSSSEEISSSESSSSSEEISSSENNSSSQEISSSESTSSSQEISSSQGTSSQNSSSASKGKSGCTGNINGFGGWLAILTMVGIIVIAKKVKQ